MLVWGISIDGSVSSVGGVSSVGIVGSVSSLQGSSCPRVEGHALSLHRTPYVITVIINSIIILSFPSFSRVYLWANSPQPSQLTFNSEFYASSNGVQSDILLFNRWDIAKKYKQRKMAKVLLQTHIREGLKRFSQKNHRENCLF